MPSYYVALFEPKITRTADGYTVSRGVEIRPIFGYARQPVTLFTFGGSDSDLTFGPIPDAPVFAAPSDHPNCLIMSHVGLCAGPVAGVDDVVADTHVGEGQNGLGSDGQTGPFSVLAGTGGLGEPLLRGESLVIPTGGIALLGGSLVISSFHVTPARGFGSLSSANWNVCYKARELEYMYDWLLWRQRIDPGFWPNQHAVGSEQAAAETQSNIDAFAARVSAALSLALGAGCTLP